MNKTELEHKIDDFFEDNAWYSKAFISRDGSTSPVWTPHHFIEIVTDENGAYLKFSMNKTCHDLMKIFPKIYPRGYFVEFFGDENRFRKIVEYFNTLNPPFDLRILNLGATFVSESGQTLEVVSTIEEDTLSFYYGPHDDPHRDELYFDDFFGENLLGRSPFLFPDELEMVRDLGLEDLYLEGQCKANDFAKQNGVEQFDFFLSIREKFSGKSPQLDQLLEMSRQTFSVHTGMFKNMSEDNISELVDLKRDIVTCSFGPSQSDLGTWIKYREGCYHFEVYFPVYRKGEGILVKLLGNVFGENE